MAGPAPIGWSEIVSYCRLTGQRLSPWEVSVIEATDNAYLKAMTADESDPAVLRQSVKDAGRSRD